MALEKELATFRSELPALLADGANVGKFVLIHGDRVDSLWPTVDEALAAGYDRFGPEPFLVQKVVEREEPQYFSRNLARCL